MERPSDFGDRLASRTEIDKMGSAVRPEALGASRDVPAAASSPGATVEWRQHTSGDEPSG